MFNTPHMRQKTIHSRLVSWLKSDRTLFSELHDAYQICDGNLNECFYQSTIMSDRGRLKVNTKSGILRCLDDGTEEQDAITPIVEVVMLE